MNRKYKISVGSWAYTYHPDADPDELLKNLGEMGFEGIELSGSIEYHHFERFQGVAKRKQLVEKLKGFGLTICGYNARLEEFPLTSEDNSIRDKYIDLFERNLKFCADCEIPAIRVDTILKPPVSLPDKNQIKQYIIDVWSRCEDKARSYGVNIVWEFEPGFIFNKPLEIEDIIKQINAPNFGALFDTSHAYMCSVVAAKQEEPFNRLKGGVAEFAKLLKGKILRVHLSDSDASLHDNLTSTHVPLGEGKLDFDSILNAIIDSGYADVWWTIDPCFWPQCHQTLPKDRDFAVTLLNKFNRR